MQNLNEHINRMKQLFGAQHGIIKPLVNEQDLDDEFDDLINKPNYPTPPEENDVVKGIPSQYKKELDWILNYKNNYDYNSLQMPLEELNIGVKDLDRKLKTLKAIHLSNLKIQPDYFNDVVADYLFDSVTQTKYGYNYKKFSGHPNDQGYTALADYFAGKIGLI